MEEGLSMIKFKKGRSNLKSYMLNNKRFTKKSNSFYFLKFSNKTYPIKMNMTRSQIKNHNSIKVQVKE